MEREGAGLPSEDEVARGGKQMKWLSVDEHGFDYCYLLPESGESERMVAAAAAAAS